MRAAAILLVTLCVAGANEARAGILIRVDKTTQRMTVTRDGQTLYDWPVSTGMAGYSTPRGAFSPSRMVADYRSREWDDAPMPHAIFFTGRGHAIHGSGQTSRLGTPASMAACAWRRARPRRSTPWSRRRAWAAPGW